MPSGNEPRIQESGSAWFANAVTVTGCLSIVGAAALWAYWLTWVLLAVAVAALVYLSWWQATPKERIRRAYGENVQPLRDSRRRSA